MIRAFVAGTAIAIIAPVIGTFLVLRRFSLFADSLAHVALAGVAIGLISGIYPVITAVITCIIAAIVIEKLRAHDRVYGDAALSLFLSGSLAVALVLISLGNGFNVNLFSYLFGSITAVETLDIYIILGLSVTMLIFILGFYKELFFIAFDEESAKVSGLPVKYLNLLLMALAATVVSLSMRVVGVLLIGALMVVPVLTALQIAKSFKQTLLYAVVASMLAVFVGLIASFYLDIIAGGAIVFIAIILFICALIWGNIRSKVQ